MTTALSFPLASAIARLRLDGRRVRSLAVERLGAFSRSSRLIRSVVRLTGRPARRIVLRSNVWPRSAVMVARALARQGVRCPVPLVYDRRTRTVMYEELPGRPLRTLPLTVRRLAPLMAPIGQLLANVHASPAPTGLETVTPERLKRERQRRLTVIRRIGKRFIRPAQSLSQQANMIELAASARKKRLLTHGDFQASNILVVSSTRLGLIDFTLSRRSFAAADVATFIVHTQAMTRTTLGPTVRQNLLSRFVRAYLRAIPLSDRRIVRATLPAFLVEAILEVAATTLQSYGSADRNARALLDLLFNPRFLTATAHV